MRLIFIPGFGETKGIFSQMAPHLPGDKLYIENLDLLGTGPTPEITVIAYAQQLIEHHQITQKDTLIGHSMGGWIAYAAKHLIGCPVVQIASWTDPKQVVLPVSDPERIYWLVQKGLLFNRFTKQMLLRRYRNRPSAAIFNHVFQRLIDSPAQYVINQLRVILNPWERMPDVLPEVIIHSKNDSIVRYPDHAVLTAPGDHFNLFTHPQDVVAVIRSFLDSTLAKPD